MRNTMAMFGTICMLLGSVGGASGAEWGDLKVTFVYGGTPPQPKPVEVTKDQEFCGKHKLVDESLVVNPQNKGIQYLFAYLYLQTGDAAPPIHPSYAAEEAKEIRLDNLNCRFQPHALGIRTGQKLILGNKDEVGHNAKIDTRFNAPINPIIPAGDDLPHQFDKAERLPSLVSCSIHSWMSARVMVTEHPYCDVTDKDGVVVLKNLPAGKWTFQFWHEKAGYVREVVQDGKSTSWTRGRIEITIKPGMNDLGTIEVNPSIFSD